MSMFFSFLFCSVLFFFIMFLSFLRRSFLFIVFLSFFHDVLFFPLFLRCSSFEPCYFFYFPFLSWLPWFQNNFCFSCFCLVDFMAWTVKGFTSQFSLLSLFFLVIYRDVYLWLEVEYVKWWHWSWRLYFCCSMM